MYEWANARRGRRDFDGARIDRLTAGWQSSNLAINEELRNNLDGLRVRSRDLAKNNEFAAKFIAMVSNNVVGPEGFIFQSRATEPDGKPDQQARKAIEAFFWDWMRPGHCEVSGKFHFVDVQRILATAWARDGEYLVRELIGPGFGPYGYQLELLDVQRIDTTYNRARTVSQNAIVMGVEIDAWRRPVNYHLRGVGSDGSATRDVIPADQIIHRFKAMEPEQVRGYPWMHAAMRRLHDLNGYREAAVIAARIGASKMGMYITPDGNPAGIGLPDGAADNGRFSQEVEPGMFEVAPAGYDFKTFDPTYPHEQFEAFNKATLRGVASGFGVSYPSLGSDLSDVNFSSLRGGLLEERDAWMAIQNSFINDFLAIVVERLIAWALLGGKILLPNGTPLPAAKLSKFQAHIWQPRRWAWVDPKKDIEAAILGIENCLDSPQRVAASQGRDIEDVLDDLAQFYAELDKRGIPRPAPRNAPAAAPPDPDDDGQ